MECSLSTDDPSICGVGLHQEYALARRAGWDLRQLFDCNLQAAGAAFLASRRDREKLVATLTSAWHRFQGIIGPR